MSGTLRAFLITAAIWVALVAAYSAIELVRGHMPFAMLEWNAGGKFITLTVLSVMALGTAVGYAGDQIRRRGHR